MKDQETILGVTLGFQNAVATNVRGCNVSFEEGGADHQEAMALQRIFIGAHHGGDASTREGKGPLDAFKEIAGATARSIIHAAIFVVHARAGGPATESFSQKFVANSSRSKANFERLAIELRKSKTGGAAADVPQRLHPRFPQTSQKNPEFHIPVALC